VLSHGKIVEHKLHIPAVTILRGVGDRLTVHASSALLDIDAAIREAEESADYWARKVRELEAERDKRA
jgi:predicted subunit of tRNA(5-methylaminomethyl-2-thiouridylate) methyltransferase